MRKFRSAVLAGISALVLAAGMAAPAAASHTPVHQDGLVNVSVGDVTIAEDVNVAVAAEVAAQVCGVEVGPVAVLAEDVDSSGDTRTICTSDQGPVRIEQN